MVIRYKFNKNPRKGVEVIFSSTPLLIFLPISKIENRQNLGKSSLSAWLCHFHLTLNYRK